MYQNVEMSNANVAAQLRDEVIKGNKAMLDATMQKTKEATRKMVEVEVKKAVDAAFSSSQWKADLTAQIMDSMQSEVVPALQQKVRETVKEIVNSTVKQSLGGLFRNSFESSLLPAFQAGTDKLFSKVQTAFEHGMEEMTLEGREVQKQNTTSTQALERELESLREVVLRLECAVRELSENVVISNACTIEIQQQETPFTLLEQGRVADAVFAALENKDISVTISVLSKLSPQQVNKECSNLVRLCITQQLAADMSVNVPEEGIGARVDWIKNLVLSLVSGVQSEAESDPAYKKNFKSMIQVVLESIQAAKKLIFSSQIDDGEEDVLEVPRSVGTDLQLLEFVIQSKI